MPGFLGEIGKENLRKTFSKNDNSSLINNKLEEKGFYLERRTIPKFENDKIFKEIDKYSWVDIGSSYLPGDLNAAYLYAQLEQADVINNDRLSSWNLYYEGLQDLERKGNIELPVIPVSCKHNAHMFYIKAKDLKERTDLIKFLKENNIYSVFHYIPLHSAPAGKRFGRFHGDDKYTTKESERLLRLPMFYGHKKEEIEFIIEKIKEFYVK